MEKIHAPTISFLRELIDKKHFDWIDYKHPLSFTFFKSGGGTHLYLIENEPRRYLARINYYAPKNDWGVKKQEYDVLKLIEPLNISPKIFFFSNDNALRQDLTIVEFIEGEALGDISGKQVRDLATDLHKLHTSFQFDRPGDAFPPNGDLPYHCGIYNELFQAGADPLSLCPPLPLGPPPLGASQAFQPSLYPRRIGRSRHVCGVGPFPRLFLFRPPGYHLGQQVGDLAGIREQPPAFPPPEGISRGQGSA